MPAFLLKSLKKRYGADREYYRMLDDIFGIYPNNIDLYKLALVHRSASVVVGEGVFINNERLEFLGDAIIEGIVSDYLFVEYPYEKEGFLTKMRSRIVNRGTLNQLCIDMGLDAYVLSHASGSFSRKNIYGDALEAMVGAIYLDKGYDFTNRLFIGILMKYLDLGAMTETESDHKSRLIEWCQKSKRTIAFVTIDSPESSARHPMFRSVVLIDGSEMGYGNGSSKKEAEQNAAFHVSHILADDEMGDHLLETYDRSEGAL